MPVKIDLVAAARPNFMKIAPLFHALKGEGSWCAVRLVHTGQHYDRNMSDAFFRDLGLPDPDIHLGVGSGTHAEQTGGVMIAYEKACLESPADWTVVAGDVNSTIACALAAAKLGIRIAHLEAGLRSRDRTMPEEINRLLTDAIADVLWTPSPDADQNLLAEGVPAAKIERVGNIMIDSLEMMRPAIERAEACRSLGLPARRYGVVTLHRPSNVDDPQTLRSLADTLVRLAARLPLVFPVHPRTRGRLEAAGVWGVLRDCTSMRLIEPASYVYFVSLLRDSAYALTDSGGLQEETTYLGIPCLTLRENTERPITVTQGTNRLVGLDGVDDAVDLVLKNEARQHRVPELWDGCTAGRVVQSLKRHSSGLNSFAP